MQFPTLQESYDHPEDRTHFPYKLTDDKGFFIKIFPLVVEKNKQKESEVDDRAEMLNILHKSIMSKHNMVHATDAFTMKTRLFHD